MTSKILHHEWLEDSEYINPDNVARDVFGDWNDREAVLSKREQLIMYPTRFNFITYYILTYLKEN